MFSSVSVGRFCKAAREHHTNLVNLKFLFFFYFFFFFFNSILRPSQDYFSSYETRQSVGGAKTGEPEKNHLANRKQNLAGLTCGQSGARTHTRHSGEMIERLRNSALNCSATWAAN